MVLQPAGPSGAGGEGGKGGEDNLEDAPPTPLLDVIVGIIASVAREVEGPARGDQLFYELGEMAAKVANPKSADLQVRKRREGREGRDSFVGGCGGL